ncbi:hypothetical protein A9174_22190 [Mesorhizobium loti NZP2037]|nr:hypothetical protein A9174_22190 [Mesorhizobium loti NZP2037]
MIRGLIEAAIVVPSAMNPQLLAFVMASNFVFSQEPDCRRGRKNHGRASGLRLMGSLFSTGL